MKKPEVPRNIIGPGLRRIRDQKGFTQPKLAEKLQRRGWDVSRETLAKIESQLRWISDFELHFLATALDVQMTDFFPQQKRKEKVLEFIARLERTLE